MTRRPIVAATVLALALAGGGVAWLLIGDDEKRPGALTVGQKGSCPGTGSGFLLDLSGDGLDLSGQTQTSLYGCVRTIRWTKPSDDDSFLAVDASAVTQVGYEIQSSSGTPLSGIQLVRDGLKVRKPDGSTVVLTDGFALLGAFDASANGTVSSSDAPWGSLKRFVDTNADGAMAANEVSPLSNVAASISPQSGQATTDAFGNTRVAGSYVSTSSATRPAADATLVAP